MTEEDTIRLQQAAQQGLTHALNAKFPGEPDWMSGAAAGRLSVKSVQFSWDAQARPVLELTAQRRPGAEDDFMPSDAFLGLLAYGLPRLGKKGDISADQIQVRPGDWHERYVVNLKGMAAEIFMGHMRDALASEDADDVLQRMSA